MSGFARIQQQLYTRERHGIFRSTEGYDTIAVSAGLDHQLVKKQLHPLCMYDAPAELAASGEKQEEAYPEAIHLLRLDNGDALLGRSIYQAADFTGLRSTFFTHHYVIPASRWESGEIGVHHALRAAFMDSYNLDSGSELPELDKLPQNEQEKEQLPPRALLAELNLGERRFMQLLYAAMTAVGGKKKVYIALDVAPGHISGRASELLELLYSHLPYAVRRQLGFMTYAKEPQSRKGIHLMFVERGSLRAGDRQVEKEFLFDLVNDRIMNADMDSRVQPYFEFIWSSLEQPERRERFFEFAAQMLQGTEPGKELTLQAYHELALLFQIEEGNDALYEQHKNDVLLSMLEYMPDRSGAGLGTETSSSVPASGKIRLHDLFNACFDREYDLVREGRVPARETAELLVRYGLQDRRRNTNKLTAYFVHALTHANVKGMEEEAAGLYGVITSDTELGEAFFGRVLGDIRLSALLFEPYLASQLHQLPTLHDSLELADQWTEAYPDLYRLEWFRNLVSEQLAGKLHSGNRLLGIVSEQLERLRARQESAAQQPGEASFLQQLEQALYVRLLRVLQLATVTREQLEQAYFLDRRELLQRCQEELTAAERQTAAMLEAAYRWMSQSAPVTELMDGLNAESIDEVQELGRRLLADRVDTAPFESIILAFYRSPQLEALSYPALIEYLHQHARRKETIYAFFKWSEQHPDFMRPRGFVPAYRSAVLAYFKQYDREAFKQREFKRQYMAKAGPYLQEIYKQAKLELSSKLARLLRKSPRMTALAVIIAGGVAVAAGAIWLAGDKQAADAPSAPQLQVQMPEAAAEPRVYAVLDSEAEAGSGEEVSALLFPFTDTSSCKTLRPERIIIIDPEGREQELGKVTYATTCESPAGESATSSGQGEVDSSKPPQAGSEATAPNDTEASGVGVTDGIAGQGTTAGEPAAPDAGTSRESSEPAGPGSRSAGETVAAESGGIQPTGQGAEQQTSNESNEGSAAGESSSQVRQDRFPAYLVTVKLHQSVPLALGSVVRVGEDEFRLTALPSSWMAAAQSAAASVSRQGNDSATGAQ